MRNRILIEIGKIKGNLEALWNLAKAKKLDRNECLNTVREIDKSLAIILSLFKTSITERLTELKPEESLFVDTIAKAFYKKGVIEVIGESISTVERMLSPSNLSSLVYSIENPQTYDDNYVKSSIANFCKDLERLMIPIENAFGAKNELLLLAEFSSLFPTFTPNWIVATVYLTAMEILVKEKLKERGKKIKGKFKENFQQLLSVLKEEKIEITELERYLPSVFWEIRHKVIHEGYSLKDEELKIIREHIINLMEKLKGYH